MPSVYNPGNRSASGGARQPDPIKPVDNSADLGRVAFNIARPGESIRQSTENLSAGFINLGKGLVNVAENLPIVGAIAKPAIGLVGGALDLTVGSAVRAAEGIKIGDQNLAQKAVSGLELLGVPIALAAQAAAIPGREVEKAVARARVKSASEGRVDAISLIFGNDGLERYNNMKIDDAQLDDIAEELSASNSGFSTNGAANLFYSLVLDPLNLISFGAGSGLKTAAKAGRIAASGIREARVAIAADLAVAEAAKDAVKIETLTKRLAKADEDIAFLDKHQLAAELHASATSKLTGVAKLTAAHSAKEMVYAFTRVFDTKKMGSFLDSLGPVVAARALKNYARTAKYTTGAVAVRRATEAVRTQSLASAESYITQLVEGIRGGAKFDEIFSGGNLGRGAAKKGYTNLRNIIYSARRGQQKLAKAEKELVKRLERSGASDDVIEAEKFALREKMADEVRVLDEPFYRLQNVLKKKIEEKAAIGNLTVEQIIRLPDIAPIIDDLERIMTANRVRKDRVQILFDAEARAASDVRIASEEATRALREAKLEVYDLVKRPPVPVQVIDDIPDGAKVVESTIKYLEEDDNAREIVGELLQSMNDGEGWGASWGSLWSEGGCLVLAEALRRKYGGKLVGFFMEGEDAAETLWHVGVEIPDGRILDINGASSFDRAADNFKGATFAEPGIEYVSLEEAAKTIPYSDTTVDAVLEAINDAEKGALEELVVDASNAAKRRIDVGIAQGDPVSQVARWMAAGLGMAPDAALAKANELFALYGNDIEGLADIAAFARGAAYGEASTKLARLVSGFDKGEEWSRLTLVSTRTLTQDLAADLSGRFRKLKDELESVRDMPREQGALFNRSVDDIEKELQALADEAGSKYDEVSQIHGNGRAADWRQVSDYIEQGDSAGAFAMRLGTDDYRKIYANMEADPRLDAIVSVGDEILETGYYLGKAPKSGIRTILTVVDDASRGERIVETIVPFFDNLAESTLDDLDGELGKFDMRPSRTQQIIDKIHRQYGAEITKSKATESFVGKMVSKAGLTVGEARDLLTRINRLASEVGTQPRGLYQESKQVDSLFYEILGDKRYAEYVQKGNDPIKDIIDASGGDWKIFGATVAVSTKAKARMPQITMMTDRLFPSIRFGELNPYFQRVLERIETATMKLIYNIWDDASDEVLGELGVTSRRRAFLDRNNINRERADNFFEQHSLLVKATAAAAESSPTFINRAKKFLGKSGKEVMNEKEIARNLMADRFAAQEFISALNQTYPEIMPKMMQHFGVSSSEDALRLLLEESIIKTDPGLLAKRIADDMPTMVGLSVKTLTDGGMALADAQRLVGLFTGVWSTQLLKGTRKADTLQYFATQRSWLERSINHPYLGVYPYSYMTRKAIPGMMRLLFLTPGPNGRILPLVGLNSWGDLVEWADNRSNTDSSFLDSLAVDDAFLYVLQTVIPVTPDSMGFATIPTYIKRTLVQPAARGKDIGVGDFATGILGGAAEQVVRGTAFGQIPSTFQGLQSIQQRTQINKQLTSGAEEIQQEIFNAFTNP